MIVGAPFYDNGEIDEGMAYVYYGSSSGLSSTANWTAESNQNWANIGYSVSTAGDVNGDGYSDVIVGAYKFDNGQTDEGRAFVYYGSLSGLSTTPNWTGESDQADAWYGVSVSTAGDVNGDGFSDVIVGVIYYDNGETNEGRAYVYYGSAGGLSTTPNWTAESNQEYAWFGYSVSTAGDVNGDGFSDVVIGADFYDNGQTNEGRAFVYYGNEGRSLSVKPQQMRSDFSVPIVPALFSDSINSFGLKHFARSNYGRVLAKTQIEVKPFGTPFNSSSFVETNWTDLGTGGLQIQKLVDGLNSYTLYKWRARVKYHPKYGLPIHSRWVYQQSNGLNEADLRTNLDPLFDQDNDGVPNSSDCRPFDSTVWSSPLNAIPDLMLNGSGTTNLTWSKPPNVGCTSPIYDVLRSTDPSDFSTATCIESNGTDLNATDTEIPSNIYYYLIRVENACGSNMGINSQGNPRTGKSCP